MTHRIHNPGRWRRRLGIGVFAIGAALCILFLLSTRWWFGYCSDSWLADMGDGTLYTQASGPNGWSQPLVGWCIGDNRSSGSPLPFELSWTWWIWATRQSFWQERSAYTVWPIAPLLMLVGASLGWPGVLAARRIRRGLCPGCGYSRAGISENALCPECGRPAPSTRCG